MQTPNQLMRGCMLVLIAGCIGMGTCTGIAITAFRSGWIAPPRNAVIIDLGPIWIGDRCRKMQQDGILIGCFASYTVAVNIKGSLQSYTIMQQPHRSPFSPSLSAAPPR
jgi:hypothetical protein